MNPFINDLLSHYQQEKDLIASQIEADRLDNDFEAMYLNSKNLWHVEHQISILKSLADPFCNEKALLQRRKNRVQQLQVQMGPIDYLQQQISQIDQEIANLNNVKPGYFNDGQEFDDAVFDLVQGKISAFIFYLYHEQLYLRFFIKKNQIRIRFTPFLEIPPTLSFRKTTIKALRIIGFRKNKQQTCFQIKFGLAHFKDAVPIKTVVARVVYEALYNYDLDRQTSMKLIP